MALDSYKILTADFVGHDVEGLDDDPLLTPAELKKRFDSAAKDVVMPKYNQLIEGLKAADLDFARTGWIPIAETLVYNSADNPTGVVKVVGKDVTANFKAGMRLKFDNGGNTIYGIVSKDAELSGSDTLITYLHEINPGTNQAKTLIANSAITNAFFSTHKVPLGFPPKPPGWTITFADAANRLQASPVAGTVYNLGGTMITVPIGAWNINYFVLLHLASMTAKAGYDVQVGLSNSPSTLTNPHWKEYLFVAGSSYTITVIPCSRSTVHDLSAKTPYYLNTKIASFVPENLTYYGGEGTTTLWAVCAYL